MRENAISERTSTNHSLPSYSSIEDDPNAEVCNALKNIAICALDLQNFCLLNDDISVIRLMVYNALVSRYDLNSLNHIRNVLLYPDDFSGGPAYNIAATLLRINELPHLVNNPSGDPDEMEAFSSLKEHIIIIYMLIFMQLTIFVPL